MNDELKKYYQEGNLISKVVHIMIDDKIDPIIELLFDDSNNSYHLITQKEKEQHIFYTIYSEYLLDEKNENFLRYIIFDYNISKENSINGIPDFNDKVKSMFEFRDLNKELSSNLSKNESSNKKIKI
jgi:hypothetical protein